MKAANAMIQDFARTQRRVEYIDVASPMFDAQGNLPGDLFVSDGLHPTPKCYALWTSIIKPVLLTRFGSSANLFARYRHISVGEFTNRHRCRICNSPKHFRCKEETQVMGPGI